MTENDEAVVPDSVCPNYSAYKTQWEACNLPSPCRGRMAVIGPEGARKWHEQKRVIYRTVVETQSEPDRRACYIHSLPAPHRSLAYYPVGHTIKVALSITGRHWSHNRQCRKFNSNENKRGLLCASEQPFLPTWEIRGPSRPIVLLSFYTHPVVP